MKFSKDYIVNSDLCENGFLSYKNIFKLLMATSNEHSRFAKATTEELQEKGYTWMIYKWRVDFIRIPKENEKIKIYTWASDFKRLNACREFEVYDEKNNKIISVSSIFLVIDLKNRKPIRIPAELADKFGVEEIKNFEKIPRINAEGELLNIENIKVKDENIDINGHVNNTVYINWIVDSLKEELKEKDIESLNLIYNREVYRDDDVIVKNYINDESYIYSEIITDEINAKSQIKLKIKVD